MGIRYWMIGSEVRAPPVARPVQGCAARFPHKFANHTFSTPNAQFPIDELSDLSRRSSEILLH